MDVNEAWLVTLVLGEGEGGKMVVGALQSSVDCLCPVLRVGLRQAV